MFDPRTLPPMPRLVVPLTAPKQDSIAEVVDNYRPRASAILVTAGVMQASQMMTSSSPTSRWSWLAEQKRKIEPN
jgi:hypothetical protein